MSITPEEKKKVVETFRQTEKDTGSPEVQVAILSTRISNLTKHLQTHMKDFHTRRGLLSLVGQRRSLLDYLKRKSVARYNKVISELGIRK